MIEPPARRPKTNEYAVDLLLLRIRATAEQVGDSFPFLTNGDDGQWILDRDYEYPVAGPWTSGFWVALLWLAYKYTRDESYRLWAEQWNSYLLGREATWPDTDVGFMYYYSSAVSYEGTGNPKWEESAIKAADRMTEFFNPHVQLLRGFGPDDNSSNIDQMMSLQLLWWAYEKTQEPRYLNVAMAHARKTVEWLVREDGSCYHQIYYDPVNATVKGYNTLQGLNPDSAWARGQSWALGGFTTAYRTTGELLFLNTARRIADFILSHLPEDLISWYDYDDPGTYRDTSAASIAVTGLQSLAKLETEAARGERYATMAEKILQQLLDNHLAPVDESDRAPAGMLKAGCFHKPHQGEFIVGSYFLMQALCNYSATKAPGHKE